MGKTLGQVAEGQLVKLNESGKPVEFYVAKQNYESGLNGAGLVLLVRKDVYQNGQWDSENINNYAESTILNWSNNTYRLKLDPWVYSSSGIVSTYIRITNASKVVETRRCLVFQLSLKELGLSNNDANIEGATLPISSKLKIANYQGSPASQWTRTPQKYSNTNAFSVNSSGSPNIGNCTSSAGYRICFCLKSNVYVADDGTLSEPIPVPKSITVPPNAMQGQPINVAWESASGVDSYILQRIKSGFWEQVYAGNDTEYTDTAGDWKNVQYRVCSVFNGANSDFRLSSVVKVVPTSTLVISGQDGDLGTIINDIPYSVNSNTGNNITLVRTINGAQVATATVQNGFSYNIPVLELPTGTNTIVITATVQASGGPVTVKRTWTYTKQAVQFPGSGGVAQLAKDGQNVFPMTLAESVKAIGGPWGGNMSTALDKLALAATYSKTPIPKYTEVKVDLSKVKAGDIVNLPENGVMVPLYVGSLDYEPTLNTSGTRVLLVRKDAYQNGQWNSTNVNSYADSTIDTWFNSTYKNMLDSTVKGKIGVTAFPYTPGNGNNQVATLTRAVFTLSVTEYGSTGQVNIEGSQVSVPETSERCWTRSPIINSGTSTSLTFNGSVSSNTFCTGSYGYRPCFTLPATFTATYYVDTDGNVHAEQEYTTAGDFYDLWGNVIPTVKIATGSYTGTGTYGASARSRIALPFRPKMGIIRPQSFGPTYFWMVWLDGCRSFTTLNTYPSNTPSNSVSMACDLEELENNVFQWYASGGGDVGGAGAQMNLSGVTYSYVFLG